MRGFRVFSIAFATILIAGCLSACGAEGAGNAVDEKKLQIVATIFPEYDWVKNVLGENPTGAEVTLLLDSGVDLHSYQPTADDILKISNSDLFIYVGGETDEWVDDALKGATNKDMVVVNLLEALGDSAKEEETVEGMQEEEEPGEGEVEYDEHVWLSLRNASLLVQEISDALKRIDPDNAGIYEENAKAYIEKLNALDTEYKAAVDAGSAKTLLFGDRFPFRYMVDDYGLAYYAAFAGCSAESEASFGTITFLSGKMDELGLHAIMTIEGSDHKIAETIVQNTKAKDQRILTLDSMQSTTSKDIEGGVTYLSVMEGNLEVLREALTSS